MKPKLKACQFDLNFIIDFGIGSKGLLNVRNYAQSCSVGWPTVSHMLYLFDTSTYPLTQSFSCPTWDIGHPQGSGTAVDLQPSGDCFPRVRLHSFLSFSPVLHFHVSFGQSCLHVPSAVHDRAILFMGCASEDIQHARPTVDLHLPFFFVTREVKEFPGGMDPHW